MFTVGICLCFSVHLAILLLSAQVNVFFFSFLFVAFFFERVQKYDFQLSQRNIVSLSLI